MSPAPPDRISHNQIKFYSACLCMRFHLSVYSSTRFLEQYSAAPIMVRTPLVQTLSGIQLGKYDPCTFPQQFCTLPFFPLWFSIQVLPVFHILAQNRWYPQQAEYGVDQLTPVRPPVVLTKPPFRLPQHPVFPIIASDTIQIRISIHRIFPYKSFNPFTIRTYISYQLAYHITPCI